MGQKPELQLDKKEFAFGKVLLHRKDAKDIKITNNTMVPVQWRLDGVELLGEEFVCNQSSGKLEPFENFNLMLHFRALKPITYMSVGNKDKKILKLLVRKIFNYFKF